MIGAHLAVSACCSAASASGLCCRARQDEAKAGQTIAQRLVGQLSTQAALSLGNDVLRGAFWLEMISVPASERRDAGLVRGRHLGRNGHALFAEDRIGFSLRRGRKAASRRHSSSDRCGGTQILHRLPEFAIRDELITGARLALRKRMPARWPRLPMLDARLAAPCRHWL